MIQLLRKSLYDHIVVDWNDINDSNTDINKLLEDIEAVFEFEWEIEE
jgi:hypothetical protein